MGVEGTLLEDVILVMEPRRNRVRETIRRIYEKSTANPSITLWNCGHAYAVEFLSELDSLISSHPYCACWLNIKTREALDLREIKRYQGERLRISLILEAGQSTRKERRKIRLQGFPVAVHYPLDKKNTKEVEGLVKSASDENLLLEISDTLSYNDFIAFIKNILLLPLEKRKRLFFTNHALASCYHLKPNECNAGISKIVIASEGKYPCYDAYKYKVRRAGKRSPECSGCEGALFCGGCRFLYPFNRERCRIMRLMLSNAREILMLQ